MYVYEEKFKTINQMFNFKKEFHLIAGPCSVESIFQLEQVAMALIKNNISFLRGGVFKPRTSPYDFQGLGIDGLKMLREIRKKYGLRIVSEIMDVKDIELGVKYLDIIQIGSRNMQNFALLKAIGKTNHPVLLKRGFMATLDEFLNAAEYIAYNGNKNIILCERGIRTFETSTRNTLDISSVAIIKEKTSLPIIVDLSHSLGRTDICLRVAKAVKALGADGIMVEVHNEPKKALSDANQQMDLDIFQELVEGVYE